MKNRILARFVTAGVSRTDGPRIQVQKQSKKREFLQVTTLKVTQQRKRPEFITFFK